MGIIEDFKNRRESGNKKILDKNFLPFKRFMALDNAAYGEGAVPVKYKEMMGLSASLTMRCNDCVTYHLANCHEAGCSEEEILEALNVGLVIGGSIVIPHLRFALEAYEEMKQAE